MSRHYVNPDEFRELARANDLHDDLVVLQSVVPTVRALGGHDSRLIEFVITDETIDRMSDKLSIDGWDTESFESNPVVLWAHSHYDPPVGKAVSLDILKKKGQIRSVAEFTPRELNPLGYMVYQMYVQRFLHAVSVGFQPREWAFVSESADAERARRGGIDFLKHELLEYSAVPVPANPNALAIARSAGIDTTPLKHWAEQVLDESTAKTKLTGHARRRLEAVRAAASPSGQPLLIELSHFTTDEDDEKAAISIDRDTGVIRMSEDTLNRAIRRFVSDEIDRATGRVSDEAAVLFADDEEQPVIELSDQELADLITEALRDGITDSLNRLTGRVD